MSNTEKQDLPTRDIKTLLLQWGLPVERPNSAIPRRCQICNGINDGTLIQIGECSVCPEHFNEPDFPYLFRKLSPGFDYYGAMQALLELIKRKEVPAALDKKQIADLKASNSDLQKTNAELKREVASLKKQIEELDKKNKELTDTVKNKDSFIGLLQVLKNCKQFEKPLDDIVKGIAEINDDVCDWLEDTTSTMKENAGNLSDNIATLRSYIESKNNESAMAMECLKKDVMQCMDSNQAAVLTKVSKLISEAVSRQSETLFTEIKKIQNGNPGISDALSHTEQAINDKIDDLCGTIDKLREEINTAAESANKPLKPAHSPIKTEPKEIRPDGKQDRHAAILDAYGELRTISEVAELTGINHKAVERYTKKLQEEGKLKSEGSNPRRYVKI